MKTSHLVDAVSDAIEGEATRQRSDHAVKMIQSLIPGETEETKIRFGFMYGFRAALEFAAKGEMLAIPDDGDTP